MGGLYGTDIDFDDLSEVVLDEDNMVSDSDVHVPTQQSVKAYADSLITGGVFFQGSYDASANTPDLDTAPAGILQGYQYEVSVGGTFFTEVLEARDVITAKQDNPTTLAHWMIVQANLVVATTTNQGYVELATTAEVDAGSDTERAVTPASLATIQSDVDTNSAHTAGDGSDHADVATNTTHSTSDGTDHANVVLNDTHRASDGTNHANVVLNDTHRASDGKDHSDVVLNNTHRASDGTDHANVVLNDTHRASDGSDHSLIDQSVVIGSSPTFNGLNITGIVSGDVDQTHIMVRKNSAGTILKGRPVYVVGYNIAGWYLVEEADNSDANKMPAVGISEVDIDNTATVFVSTGGHTSGIDTSAYVAGDELYVAAALALTTTKPTGTALIQKIAQVGRSHATLGTLIVEGAGRQNDIPNIASANFWLGNASAVATPVTMSGKVTMTNAGVTSIASDSFPIDLFARGIIAATSTTHFKDKVATSYVYHGPTCTVLNVRSKTGTPDSSATEPTVDVTFGGVSCLTGAITNSATADTEVAGTIDTGNDTLTDGDVIELSVVKGTNEDASDLHVSLVVKPD